MSSISIIIPVLNEAMCLNRLLVQLEDWRNDKDDVIFVDGGSEDASRNLILASGSNFSHYHFLYELSR
jgi:glycosyltransferase involved in cell wall biosynthesis